MNIFILDRNTIKCAESHNNKHVVKMIVEYSQLLCSAHWVSGSEAPYKLSHKNHPCSIWTRTCLENYVYLCDLAHDLAKEYTYRYGKRHKSQDIIEWCMINLPNLPEKGDITPFALAMPDECKIGDGVESYRNYYITHKRHIAEWKRRDVPNWYL
jgi:hypothetical protein